MEAGYWILLGFLLGVAFSAVLVVAVAGVWRRTRPEPEAVPKAPSSELPRANLAGQEVEIANMQPGESAYTVPWAMQRDEDGGLQLRGDYPAEAEAAGTASLYLERNEEGFVVDLDRSGEDSRHYLQREPLEPRPPFLASWRPRQVVELRGQPEGAIHE